MASPQQGLKGLAGAVGIFFGALLLSMLVGGFNIVAGSNNIDIGGYGFTDESNTIRIGNQGGPQKKTFIAGTSGTPVVGADVTVNGNGQLGVLPSSARYKRDIHDMGRRERRSDEAATSHFPLQERPQRHIAVWLGG